jgi:AcrR family transcriptional regulator
MPKLSPGPGLSAAEVAAHQLARIREAMVELVAAEGYGSLKVRDLVARAEVSTRAFYQHFSSKEDCFLQAYQLISRRASRQLIAAQGKEPSWRKRPYLVFEEFVRQLEKEPASARLALVEAYRASEAALAQVFRAERTFEAMLAEAFSRRPSGVLIPPLVVQGMVAGVAAVSRRRLLGGQVLDLTNHGEELVEWALCYPHPATAELHRLDRQSIWRDTTLEPYVDSFTGDRALILRALAKLAAEKGYSGLTAPRVCSAAKVSRRKFETHFDHLEHCYLAAVEQHATEAMSRAARAQTAAASEAGGIYRAIAALTDHVASDAFLAHVCLFNDFPCTQDGIRSRERLSRAILELLTGGSLFDRTFSQMKDEASASSVWALFHHHVVRDRPLRKQISATLSYLVLAPAIGAPAALEAIRAEQ